MKKNKTIKEKPVISQEKQSIKKWMSEVCIVCLILFSLTYLYLSPGSRFLFEGKKDVVLSDGTDQLTAPYIYSLVLDRLAQHPTEFFYGAVYSEKVNPPMGFVFWMNWLEKIFLVISTFFLPLEQINAGISFAFIFLSGFSMFCLGRFLSWNKWISLGMGMSWGFNAFTLARAKVHPGFTALFFLPLLFIVLKMIQEKMTTKNKIIAAIILLIAFLGPQYFIVTTAFLLFFWLVYLYLISEGINSFKLKLKNLIVVSIIPIFVLIWIMIMPVPSEVKNQVIDLYPATGESTSGVHPFMYQFAADPLDYLSGNLGLTLSDVNPLKEQININIYQGLAQKGSNNHEHAVGIRWVLLAFVFIVVYLLIKRKNYFNINEKNEIYFFLALGIFTFYLSLSPSILGMEVGPSLWLHKLISQIRVPSRAGVFVHFSVLMITGIFLNKLLQSDPLIAKKYKFINYLFPVLIFLEFPPIYDVPTSTIVQSRISLANKNCGLGMYFPYVSASYDLLTFYRFQQSMRNTNCYMLNSISPLQQRDSLLLNNFAKHPTIMEKISNNDSRLTNSFVSFAQCMSLDWIVFDEQVPLEWRKKTCDQLGWQLNDDFTCVGRFSGRSITKEPIECLR